MPRVPSRQKSLEGGSHGASQRWAGSAGGNLGGGDLLATQARRRPHATALVNRDRTLDYLSLNKRSNRLANALAAMGSRRGDRAAILSENRAEYIETVDFRMVA